MADAGPVTARDRLLVLYDADCGVCTRTAGWLRRLDRRGRLELVPLQAVGTAAADAPPDATLREALHVRAADGRWSSGGAAMLEILARLPAGTPIARFGRLPLVCRGVDAAYRVVARHRTALSRALGATACATNPGPEGA